METLLNAIHELETAGVFGILLEAIPPQAAKVLTDHAKAIIFGIGVG